MSAEKNADRPVGYNIDIPVLSVRALTPADMTRLKGMLKRTNTPNILYFAGNLDDFEGGFPDSSGKPATPAQPTGFFVCIADGIDLLLEPEAADGVIGDLAEGYAKRLHRGHAHAKRWLVAQFVWVIFGRVLDLYGRFSKARAGK